MKEIVVFKKQTDDLRLGWSRKRRECSNYRAQLIAWETWGKPNNNNLRNPDRYTQQIHIHDIESIRLIAISYLL